MKSGHSPSPAGGPEAILNARARRAKRIPGARLRTAATLLVLAAAAVAFLQYDDAGTFPTGDWIVAPSMPEWQQVPDAMPGHAFAQTQGNTPPTFVSSGFNTVTRVLTITFSEAIDVTPAANVVAAKIHVRESGSYAGGITLTAGELVTAADASTISFTLNMSRLETVKGLAAPELTIEPGAVRDTSGDLIASTFDVSTATFAHIFSVLSRDTAPTGMAFSNDGAKMFVVDDGGNDISEYALTTPFNVTAAAHVRSFNVSSQDETPTGMAFSNDGAKMFVVGNQKKNINEYTLSTPFDLSTASFADVTFLVSSQETSPQGMAFSNDGTKMFVVGSSSKNINEYTLTTPFDISTATFADVTFPVLLQDRAPVGMAFSNDGAKMFVVGLAGDAIHEYALTAPFDISTATFADVTFPVSPYDSVHGMAFSNDGAKMFVVTHHGSEIIEYTLSSVYPIRVTDGTLPTFVSSGLDLATGVLAITFSEDIDVTPAASVVAAKIHVRESGNYTGGGITLTAGEFGTAADASTISFTLTKQHREAVAGLRAPELTIEPGAVQDTFGNLIVGTFDVSTAAFDNVIFPVSSQDASPRGMAFSNDGAKMFVVGWDGTSIHEYALTTPFDVTAAAPVRSFNVSSQDSDPTGMAFSNDGAKMFVVDDGGNDISEYALPTPFDVTAAAHVRSFNVSSQDAVPTGMAFSNDGAKMFVVDDGGNDISEYALPAPFDVTAAAHVRSFNVSAQDIKPEGMAFSNDGAKMFVVGDVGNGINEYALPAPFDVTAARFVHSFNVSSQEALPRGVAFSNDGAKMFVVGNQKKNINEYALSSVYPVRVSGNLPPTDGTPPTFASSGLDTATGVLTITFSEDIDVTPAANVVASKIHVRESGTYAGGITLTAGELGTAADASTISFTLTGPRLETVKGLAAPELTIEPGAVRDTSGNLIVSTFDVSTATFADVTFSVFDQDTVPTGMAFSNDGDKMFVVGSAGDAIHEYTLTTPFDITTAAFAHSFNVTEQDTFPTGVAFSNDGAKMFVVGNVGLT